MSNLKPFISALAGILAAAGYGIFVRLAFGSEQFSTLFGTISVGFLFLTPLALGALTQFFAPAQFKSSWPYAVFVPWGPCLLFGAIATVLTWEAWICVVMALPIFLAMSSVGGVIIFAYFKSAGKSEAGVMGLLLLIPFIITPLENQFLVRDSIRVVHTRIEVNADAETVWRNITRVPEITEAERRFSFFHLAGLPSPVRATLTYDGVGGVRRGQWGDGLAFIETISDWQLHHSYTMQMQADISQVKGSRLPLHEIGGKYFDVIEGKYTIEPAGEDRLILHFTSRHRLSTGFNFYAGFWTDFFMRDVQYYILQIVKARSEAGS